MLIVTRKINQEIHIGEGVVLTILDIRGKQVRLGIKAPRDVHIRRAELEPLPITDLRHRELMNAQG